MAQARKLPAGVLVIVAFHLLGFLLWFFGQTLAVVDYDMVAGWGLQPLRALTDPTAVQVNRAAGLTDTLVMLPLYVLATRGLLQRRFYGAVCSWLVFGITLYWPVMFWSAEAFYALAGIQRAPLAASSVVVPAVCWAIAAWGSWYLYRNRARFR